MEQSQRVEEFKSEIASMQLAAPVDRTERTWLFVGIGLFVAGVVFIGFGWFGASGEVDVAKQVPYLISGGITGIGLIIAGCALFVRFSLGRYLRFWLVRDLYEQRAQTDRIVAALGGSPPAPAQVAPATAAPATAAPSPAAPRPVAPAVPPASAGESPGTTGAGRF